MLGPIVRRAYSEEDAIALLSRCRTVYSLATANHDQLARETLLNPTGLKRLAADAVLALAPPLRSARECKKERLQVDALLPTGVPALNDLLGGGLATGEIHELIGAPQSGKTGLCLLACAATATATAGSALFIDTAGHFSARRLYSMMTSTPALHRLSRSQCKQRLQERIRAISILRLPELLDELDVLDAQLTSRPPSIMSDEPARMEAATTPGAAMSTDGFAAASSDSAEPALQGEWLRRLRLVVVDSVWSAFCGEHTGAAESAAGRQLVRLQARLRELAVRHHLAIIITNGVAPSSTTLATGSSLPRTRLLRAALGHEWQHTASTRLLLEAPAALVDAQSAASGERFVRLLHVPCTARPMRMAWASECALRLRFADDCIVASSASSV